MTTSIRIGSPFPETRRFVPGHRARTVAAVGQGECLVLYVGGIGVRSSIIDVATRWPLPTLPRTTYAAVAIVDEKDPAALRSRVGHAVVATLSGPARDIRLDAGDGDCGGAHRVFHVSRRPLNVAAQRRSGHSRPGIGPGPGP